MMFGVSAIGGIAAGVSGTNPSTQAESAQDKQQTRMT